MEILAYFQKRMLEVVEKGKGNILHVIIVGGSEDLDVNDHLISHN